MKKRFSSLLTLCSASLIASSAMVCAQTTLTQGAAFFYTSANSATIGTTASQYATFTAPETANASSVSLYLNSTTAPSLTFGLQLDDGTGKPTGTYVASGTVTSPAAGWNTINFGNYQLQAGQVYHVVADKVSSGSSVWRLLTGVNPGIQSFGISDPNLARGTINSAGTFSAPVTTSGVVFRVGTDGSLPVGQVYYSASSTGLTSAVAAQRFIFNAGDTGNFLSTVTVRLNVGATLPANDVSFSILDSSNTVLKTVTLASSDLIAGTTGQYEVDFSGLSLVDGGQYNLALSSLGSAANSVKWIFNSADNFYDTTYQGTNAYTFSYSDLTFSNPGGVDLSRDYVFYYTTTAIPEPGSVALGLLGIGLAGLRLRRRRNG